MINYTEAQEGIAKVLYNFARPAYRDNNVYYRRNWEEIPDYEPFRLKFLEIRREYEKEADHLLLRLFTPEEIEEWEKGGYPAIVYKDQTVELLSDEDCPLCGGLGEILNSKVRAMGYTLADGETIDEKLTPCPLCERVKAQASNMTNAGFRRVKGVR